MKIRQLDSDHDWTFGQGRHSYAVHSEAIAQSVMTRLLSLQGDWFLDKQHGIRWFNYFTKNPNLMQMEHELKRTILETQGVAELTEFNIVIDANRQAKVSATIKDFYGMVTEVSTNAPNYR